MATATVGILRVILSGNSAEFESAMKRASGAAQAMSKDLGQIGRQATQIGSALTKTITLPILALGVGSIKAAMDFETSFANVAKTVDGVSDKTGKLTKDGAALAMTFRNMAKEIPATTDELNKIAALGGQMGVPIQQLETFTRHVAALGVAVDGISTEEAAAGLASIGNATGTGTTKIAEMASALVHLGNNSNATEADILEFTKRLVGAGHSAGMTVPEVMAIGTAMANVGINAEAGGTAMSTVIGKISKAVSLGNEDLKDFAKVAGKTAEEFTAIWKRSSAEGIDLFVQGLSTMKARGVDLNLTMGELGTEGIRVASTLKLLAGAGDGVSKSIKLANEGYADGNKHLEEAAKKYATTANQMKLFWNQVNDIGITLGNAFLPAVNEGIKLLSGLLPIVEGIAKAFAALPGPLQGVIGGLALVLAATGPVIWVFGQLTTSASVLIGAFGKKGIAARLLATAFGTVTASATPAAASVTALGTSSATAAVGVGGLTAALGTAMFWSGIGIAIGGIAFGVYKVVGAIKDASKALSEGRFWEFFLAKDKDNWLRGALGMDTGKAPPPKPIATMTRAEDNAEFEDAVKRSRELAAANVAATAAKDKLTTSTGGLSKGLQEASERSKQYTDDMKSLTAEQKASVVTQNKQGVSLNVLAKEFGVNEDSLDRYIKSLKEGEKSSKAHTTATDKQAEALEKLGVVTAAGVNKSLGELAGLVKLATSAGVPLDNVLASMVPRFKELADKARASGAGVKEAAEALDMAEAAARRLAEPLRLLSTEHIPLIGRTLSDTTKFIEGHIDLGAKAMTDAFKFFGLTTRAELDKTEREAIANFNLIKASGTATPEQIQKAFDEMNKAIRENGGNTATELEDAYKRMGITTQQELDNAAFQAVLDFNLISNSADATAVDIEAAAKRMEVALVAAGDRAASSWMDNLGDLVGPLRELGQAVGGKTGTALSGASNLLGAYQSYKTQGKMTSTQKAGAIVSGAASVWSSTGGGQTQGQSTMSGMMAGAQAGMAFGPYGAAIGAAAGAITGFVRGMTVGRRTVKEFAAEFGGFDDLHKRLTLMGAEGERIWVNLTQKVANNDFTAAGKAIDEARSALDKFGTEAERAERRLTAIGLVVDGVNAKAVLFAAPFEALKAAREGADANLAEINKKFKEAGDTGQAEFERIGIFAGAAFAGMVKETGNAIGAIQQLGPTITILKQGIDEFGLSGTGTINALLSNFEMVNSTITGPILSSIQATGQIFTGLRDGGLMTSELFQTVATDIGASFRDLEAKGGDVSKAMALSQPVLQDLWEAQEKYGTVTDETTLKLLEQAEEQGLVGAGMKDVNLQILDVLMAIADVFGADIPEGLRKTKEAAKTTAKGMTDDFETAEKEIQAGAIATAKALKEEFDKSARGIQERFGGIRIAPIRVPIEYDDPGYTPSGSQAAAQASMGGFVTSTGIQYRALGGPIRWTSRGTDTVPAMLTPGEGVLSTRGMEGLHLLNSGRWLEGLKADLLASGVPAHSETGARATFQSVTVLEVDKRELGRAVADVLPGELRRLGVRVRA